MSAPTRPRIVIDPASGLINPISIFNSVVRQRPHPHLPEAVELGYIFNANDGVGHGKRGKKK